MRASLTPSMIPAGEAAAAALSFALAVPFALFVALEGSVAPSEYLKILSATVAGSVLIVAGAVIFFALAELIRAGRRTAWAESPSLAIASAFRRRWAEDRLFSLAWPVLLFVLLIPAFMAFKQRILPHAGFLYDPALAGLDRALFGTDPGLLLHQLFGSPGTTRFFDWLYHGWFVPTTLGVAVVGLCAGTRTRAQYMLAYTAVWIVLGAILAYLIPAAGPAFYKVLAGPAGAEPFLAVHAELAAAGDASFLTALGNQAYLLDNLNSPVLVMGGGISAIPSIHNAMAVLFAVASFRIHKSVGLAMTTFALVIWLASVYLNWHYAVDGLAGAAGALAIWFASGRIVDGTLAFAERRPAPAPATAPAAA